MDFIVPNWKVTVIPRLVTRAFSLLEISDSKLLRPFKKSIIFSDFMQLAESHILIAIE